MKILGIDQSLSKCAITGVDNLTGEVFFKAIIRTGNLHSKSRNKGVVYHSLTCEQIKYICSKVADILIEQKPDKVNFEGLAFGAKGDQKNNLGVLLNDLLKTTQDLGIPYEKVTPTNLKNFARGLLPEDQQVARDTWGRPIYLKSKKPKLKKMEKKDMVAAVLTQQHEDFFEGLNYSNGRDDRADSYLLAIYK